MSESEINRIKKVLGNHYSKPIIKMLNKMQIVNSSGNPYSAGSIRKIVNGNQPNEEIELQILKIVANAEKKQMQRAAKRKLLAQS